MLPALEAQLVRAAVPVRAVLMPQYFGLRQDMSALSRLCQRHGAALVEDCSHALPLTRPDNHMGLSGTYAISSPYKFFPCPDGGVLWSNTGQDLSTLARLQWPGLRTELRHWAGLRAQARQRAPAHATTGQVEAEPFGEQAPACDKLWRGSEPSPDYRPADCVQACSLTSRALIALTDIPALLARRRSHYNTWVDATADLAGAQAFNPQLSADDTPYMFPLLLRDPQRHFAKLKHAGLPIFHWDSLARSTCATSAHYRLHLLHLPCHQALRDTDLDWMISTLRRVLQGASTSARA